MVIRAENGVFSARAIFHNVLIVGVLCPVEKTHQDVELRLRVPSPFQREGQEEGRDASSQSYASPFTPILAFSKGGREKQGVTPYLAEAPLQFNLT